MVFVSLAYEIYAKKYNTDTARRFTKGRGYIFYGCQLSTYNANNVGAN